MERAEVTTRTRRGSESLIDRFCVVVIRLARARVLSPTFSSCSVRCRSVRIAAALRPPSSNLYLSSWV